MLRWTFHPLVDVGIATLCAMANQERPEDLTAEHLDRITEELSEIYFSKLMNSYLTCVFMNSAYVQPNMRPVAAAKYRDEILKAHRRKPPADLNGIRCAFSGEPAVEVVHRGQIPMLTGEETLNFFPAGLGGLLVAGPYLTAIQALPMGCKRVEGKLFAAIADVPELTLALTRRYVEDNRRLIALARAGKLTKDSGPQQGLEREISMGEKYPDSKSPASLITWDLMEVLNASRLFQTSDRRSASLTCYWLSSSGQGPSLDLFFLPSNLIRFLVLAGSARYRDPWQRAVSQAWRPAGKQDDSSKKRKATHAPSSIGGPGRSRNDLLDDLVRIYRDGNLSRTDARAFIERHLVRYRRGQSGARKVELVEWLDWNLTELFLKEVLGMTEERIKRIRDFADKLADHVASTNDRKLFRGVVYSTRSFELRNALTRAQRTEAHDHNKLLFGLSDYLDVFEAEEVVRLGDWSLTRDLISIRLVEILHNRRFFEKNADLLDESLEQETVR